MKHSTIKKALGFDKVAPEMIKELCKKVIIFLSILFSVILTKQFKTAEMILIAKSGKKPNEVFSCRPVSLFLVISKPLQ